LPRAWFVDRCGEVVCPVPVSIRSARSTFIVTSLPGLNPAVFARHAVRHFILMFYL
jgi:hypothetical protein